MIYSCPGRISPPAEAGTCCPAAKRLPERFFPAGPIGLSPRGAPLYLSFPVHPNDPSSGLVGRRDKNGLPADPVHVDAGPGFQVVQVDVAVFSNEEDDILLGTDLGRPRGNSG